MPNACGQESRVSLMRTGNGRYAGEIANEGNRAGSCAMAAAMLSAALDLGGGDVVPVSITTYLLADPRPGPCTIAVKWIRGNGRLQCWQAELRQASTVASSQILLTGDLPSSFYLPTSSDAMRPEAPGIAVAVDSPYADLARALDVSPRDLIGEDSAPCSVALRFHVDTTRAPADLVLAFDAPRSSGDVRTRDVRLLGSSGLVAVATYAFLGSHG